MKRTIPYTIIIASMLLLLCGCDKGVGVGVGDIAQGRGSNKQTSYDFWNEPRHQNVSGNSYAPIVGRDLTINNYYATSQPTTRPSD